MNATGPLPPATLSLKVDLLAVFPTGPTMKSILVHLFLVGFSLNAFALTGFAEKPGADDQSDNGKIVVVGRASVKPTKSKVSLSGIAENARSIATLPATQKPDGFFQELSWIITGPPRWPSRIRVETVSGWDVSIISAQLFYDDGGLLLRGKVERTGTISTDGYLDARLLDENRQLIRSWKVQYFPRDLPRIGRGSLGWGSYAKTISPVPPKLAYVVVQYHGR